MRTIQNKTPSKNCIIYARVATIDQSGESISLENQKTTCEQYARKNEYFIHACFSYMNSGFDHQELENIFGFIDRHNAPISYIIIASPDRLSRSYNEINIITDRLKNHGIEIIYPPRQNQITKTDKNLYQNIN